MRPLLFTIYVLCANNANNASYANIASYIHGVVTDNKPHLAILEDADHTTY